MKPLASVLALLASGVVFSTAAVANDASSPAPVVSMADTAPQMTWGGSYVGVFGGRTSGHIKVDGCVGICYQDPKLSGNLFGLQAGYDWEQPNHVVTGVFAWVPLARPKSPLVETIPGIGTVSDQIKQRFTAVLGARVGYAYDTWLPYAFAGLDYTGLRVTTGPGSSFAKNYDHTYVGLAAGVGVEHALTRHVSLDLRYMYTHLPSRTFNFGGGPEKYSEPNGSTLTVGITYRF
ncbi:outer membrane protein [Solirhodobacter olei]|uniref:outer membrane protein n=1 Tax=Solirhodobacter olei TaxID=2493082 RepID=UPI000FDA7F01|nr:outer membrane beta-barrel protein [Solirhodobacter olei]